VLLDRAKVDGAKVDTALPDYDVGDVLGEGTYGAVLEGRHRRMGRRVAIKILKHVDRSARDRFALEARVLAGLDRPHVVKVYDYREHEGLCLLVPIRLGRVVRGSGRRSPSRLRTNALRPADRMTLGRYGRRHSSMILRALTS
jgi:serine/threonine protein kinase